MVEPKVEAAGIEPAVGSPRSRPPLLWLRVCRASSFDKHENATEGFSVTLQVWRLVLDWFVTWRVSE